MKKKTRDAVLGRVYCVFSLLFIVGFPMVFNREIIGKAGEEIGYLSCSGFVLFIGIELLIDARAKLDKEKWAGKNEN